MGVICNVETVFDLAIIGQMNYISDYGDEA